MSWPLARPDSLRVAARPLFTPDECERIVALADAQAGWTSAGVYNQQEGGRVDLATRSVRSTPLPSTPDGFPLARLVEGLAAANDDVYRYDLSLIPAGDHPSVLRYDADAADHFRAHRDVGDFAATRKLTFTVQLTDPADYVGCDLVFTDLGIVGDRTQGTLVTFPSYEMHRVTPVVRGTRHAIVGWVHGSSYV